MSGMSQSAAPTVAVPVTEAGEVGHRWGRAERVAVAGLGEGSVRSWTVHDVRWDVLHDEGGEGQHHARVVRFLREHGITHVVADHMGAGMARMLATMEITVVPPAARDARSAVLAVLPGAGDGGPTA